MRGSSLVANSSFILIHVASFFQASLIETSIQSGKIYTYQERLKETETNNAELRKILRRYSKGDRLARSPFAKIDSKSKKWLFQRYVYHQICIIFFLIFFVSKIKKNCLRITRLETLYTIYRHHSAQILMTTTLLKFYQNRKCHKETNFLTSPTIHNSTISKLFIKIINFKIIPQYSHWRKKTRQFFLICSL